MQLRALLRTSGVEGVPGVRVRVADARTRGRMFEITIEDAREETDRISEARGIRFYVDPNTAHAIDRAVLDLEGSEFVFRQGVSRADLEGEHRS